MSYTEINKFDKTGNAVRIGRVKNAWRGAMRVWDYIDETYLEPYKPTWAIGLYKNEPNKRFHRTSDQDEIKKVWAQFNSEKITHSDNIILGSTFDHVVVLKESLPELIKIFRESAIENSSLSEQADIIEEELKADPELLGICWNHTSVNQDGWIDFKQGKYDDESEPYNLLTDTKHWNLFDDLKK